MPITTGPRRLLALLAFLLASMVLAGEKNSPPLPDHSTEKPGDAPVTLAILGDAFESEPPELIEDVRGVAPTRYRDAARLWAWSATTAPRLVDPRSPCPAFTK